jgi:hypothetical protein
MGFAPYDNPEYITLITINQPQKEKYGSTASGPVWHDVMSEVMRYKSIPKKDAAAQVSVNVPDVRFSLYADGEQKVKTSVPSAVIERAGEGEVITKQSYTYSDGVLHITLTTSKIKDEFGYHFPNLAGKDVSFIDNLLKPYHLTYTKHGKGALVEQSISPGNHATLKSFSIWFESK